MRGALYVTGAILELGGILLVAWPDFSPYGARASLWLHAQAARLDARLWLRRLFRRPRRHVIHAEPGTLTLGAGSPTVVVSPSAEASLEDRVEYLIRREQETRTKLDSLDQRLGAIEEDVPERIEDLRVETREHVAGALSAAEARYRPLRFVGALLLAAGLGLTTAGNFV